MDIKHLHEFKSENDLQQYFANENFCIEYFIKLRWRNGVRCTKCNSDNIQTNDNKKFRCRDCRKQFSYLQESIFENTKKPLQEWFSIIYTFLQNKGISSYSMADKAGTTQTTSWLMLHKIRHNFRFENFKKMFGLTNENAVQLDEAGIHGRNENRACHNKKEYAQGRSVKNTKAFGMVEGSNAKLFQVPNANAKTLTKIILRHIEKNAEIHTDDWTGYSQLIEHYVHQVVNHSGKEFCNGNAHTNRIERLWKSVKDLIFGTHHKVSDKYLQAYLNEMVFRNNNADLDRFTNFENILSLSINGRLTRRELSQRLAA
jgi:transposase-like protein